MPVGREGEGDVGREGEGDVGREAEAPVFWLAFMLLTT